MFWAQLVLTGAAQGAVLALAGMGVVLTYRATGVFNFAHASIGVFVAYALFQLNREWGIPVGVAAPLALLVVGPAVGVVLERLVFRPLSRAGATTTEKLVATLGVFVMLTGLVFAVWTGTVRPGVKLFSPRSFEIVEGLRLGYEHLGIMIMVTAISAGLWALFRHTHLGTEIRAVVDRPDLAALAGVNVNRTSALAWAMGTGLAGLAGVLLSSTTLNPIFLNLVLIETFSLAVVARLTSLPLAVAAGVLLLGVGQALLSQATIFGGDGVLGGGFDALKPNLSVVILFAALLLYTRLDVVGEAAERIQRIAVRPAASPRRGAFTGIAIGLGLLLLPAALDANGLDRAHTFLALTIIFASIVAVTGFSGQITLGQAGYAGLGAWAAARMAGAWGIPTVLAMVLGALVALVAGVLTGWPALRRRGLFLALTTLAFGLLIFRFVLQNKAFAAGADALQVTRPSLFGWELRGPVAFYYFELVWVGLMLLVARNVRTGRLGRALGAMRDSEPGARSVGIDLRAYKVFIFGISAFMAGIGGALLTQKSEVFGSESFFPLESLFWFAVVVVAGVNSIVGAVIGAFIWVMLSVVLETEGLSELVIGAGAILLGRLPGGNLVGMLRVTGERITAAAVRAVNDARRRQRAGLEPRPVYVPSDFARHVLSDGDGQRRFPARRQQ